MNLQDVYLAEELRRNKIIEDNIILLRVVRFSYNSFFMCAQHGHVLIGESPQWGLIVPTISLRQGCPS
jgi:hypothetical protein